MQQIVLLVIATAIVASVQSMDLTRPSLAHEPQVAVDTYPAEHVRHAEGEEDRTDGTANVDRDSQGYIENGEYSRVVRSPKEPVSGRVVVEGSARKGSSTGGKTEGNVYVGGQIRFRRSPRKHRHRTNVDISVDKKLYDGKHGSISVGGGASKRPGERWDPHVGVSGSIRF